jgi:two-component system C4-dicarboxylate transport response regulator DctD
MTRKVLIVDDDREVREALGQTLEIAGLTPILTSAFIAAKDHITAQFEGIIISDMMMPGRDGFHLLDYAHQVDRDLPVILLTGQGDVPTAVKALDGGAFAFLEKPCGPRDLMVVVEKALMARDQILKTRAMKREVEHGDAAARMLFGTSDQAKALRDRTRAVAKAHAEVVVTGEPGAGTSKVAEVIHLLSAAARDPFVKRAGAALTVDALEDAIAKADTGTLFIDEVGSLPVASQFFLAEQLDSGIGPRIIAGSTHDFDGEVAAGRFHGDLFYRLDLMRVHIPALRERSGDIPILFRHFVAQACEQANLPVPEITADVTGRLMAQEWSGNARALMNAAMRFAMGLHEVEPSKTLGLADQMAQIEKSLIVDALRRCNGQATETAKALHLPRKTFYDKLAKHGLRAEDFRLS